MPTYDYKCKKCQRLFEVVQSMNDAPLRKCAECGGAVKRLIGAGAGLIFKGSGFYCTDYKAKNAGAPGATSESKDAAPANKDAVPADKSVTPASKDATTAKKIESKPAA